ncbi:hypothetical protein GCM10023089_12510 [Quisquiliibacterium transsilvanicum]|uniref:O-acetylhomoserine/O-acetylserine sulfhydrylase-like pyridoxal-dependent enzyme n=1 Tax=Quisquiliibacterium transsilvanicum TaxID=1549638 RepID=A0A7W8HFM4_9BURK|nr:O-acetylhomoserine/O-acetylserine sulfhydrylase-like pyridoxal-dependent enzyme [Quisquiliibacterium transsilvanicum]
MKLETLAVHAGYTPEPTTKSVAVPIYQTTSYAFDSAQHGADLFDLKVAGNIYTRIMNPTTDVLEKRVAAMEGGIGGLALASGQSAITYAIQTIAEAGDNIVSATRLYGGTYNLFAHTLPQFGITTRFANGDDPASFAALIDERTKAVFVESVGNPSASVADIAAIAKVAHAHGVPLIVDNTVPSPYLLRPIEHGADIVVHSLTKYIGGHGNSIGGLIVDSGKFPWGEHKARFRRLNEPDPSYHGVNYVEALGAAAYIARARRAAAQHRGRAVAVQRLPDPAGAGDAAAAHGPDLGQRAGGGAAPGEASGGELGGLSGPGLEPAARACAALPAQGCLGRALLRGKGRSRRRRALPGRAAAGAATGQHRRYAFACDASWEHDAPAAVAR